MLEEFRDGVVRQLLYSRIQIARPAQAQKYSGAKAGLGDSQRSKEKKNKKQAVGGVWLVGKDEKNRQNYRKTQSKKAHYESFLDFPGADVAKFTHILCSRRRKDRLQLVFLGKEKEMAAAVELFIFFALLLSFLFFPCRFQQTPEGKL